MNQMQQAFLDSFEDFILRAVKYLTRVITAITAIGVMLTAAFAPVVAWAEEYLTQQVPGPAVYAFTQETAVEFNGTATALLGAAFPFTGEGGTVTGVTYMDQGKVWGMYEVELSKFKTGMDGRDEHLRKVLEVVKHPKALLKLKPTKMQPGEFRFDGELTVKGVSAPVTGTASVTADGPAYRVRAVFRTTLSAHSVKPPEAKLIAAKVSDDVEVVVAGKAEPKA